MFNGLRHGKQRKEVQARRTAHEEALEKGASPAEAAAAGERAVRKRRRRRRAMMMGGSGG